jgi:hypothetical protein
MRSAYRTLQSRTADTDIDTAVAAVSLVEVALLSHRAPTRSALLIRQQLAARYSPVVGDPASASASASFGNNAIDTLTGGLDSRLYLHLREIRLARPGRQGDITITSETPAAFSSLLEVAARRGALASSSKPKPDAEVNHQQQGVVVGDANIPDMPGMRARGAGVKLVSLQDYLGGDATRPVAAGRGNRGSSRGRGRGRGAKGLSSEPPPR